MCVLLLVAAAAGPAAARQGPAGEPEDLLGRAGERFTAGLAAHEARAGSGQADFLAAAALYHELIDQHGIQNHALHANRGAALLLGGDVGRAVAAFRRAQRLAPDDPAVVNGLAAARARVQTAVTPAPESHLREALLAWRGRVERATLLGIAVTAYIVAWLAGAARVLGVRRAIPVAAAAAAVSLLAAAPLAIEAFFENRRDAVVVAAEVVGLNGPSHGAYAPTFESPLTAGVECEIIERRDGWARVRLADARETWLPADAVEPI
jgi:hypothetical protein